MDMIVLFLFTLRMSSSFELKVDDEMGNTDSAIFEEIFSFNFFVVF